MSRIGKIPVTISDWLTVTIKGQNVHVKWPKWEIDYTFTDRVTIKENDSSIIIEPVSQDDKALWGTTRSVISNMIEWVSTWYKKTLEIKWVGYKFEVQWKVLILSIGFSHKVEMPVPQGIEAKIDDKAKNLLHISWVDKQQVWEFAAKIKSKKKPEPYKGKWISYQGEYIRRKAWKTGSK